MSSFVPDSLRPCGRQPARLLCPQDSPGKNTGVGCHAFLQGIFMTQELNPGLLTSFALAGGFCTTSATWESPSKLKVGIRAERGVLCFLLDLVMRWISLFLSCMYLQVQWSSDHSPEGSSKDWRGGSAFFTPDPRSSACPHVSANGSGGCVFKKETL